MSTLNVSNITDGTTTVGTSYVVNGSAKAWANLNGQGTIALRDSFNTSSVTDVTTGTYRFNYTSSMANSSYSAYGLTSNDGRHVELPNEGTTNTNVSYLEVCSRIAILRDANPMLIGTLGDLA